MHVGGWVGMRADACVVDGHESHGTLRTLTHTRTHGHSGTWHKTGVFSCVCLHGVSGPLVDIHGGEKYKLMAQAYSKYLDALPRYI
jgi:hypothetical protein